MWYFWRTAAVFLLLATVAHAQSPSSGAGGSDALKVAVTQKHPGGKPLGKPSGTVVHIVPDANDDIIKTSDNGHPVCCVRHHRKQKQKED